MSPRGPLHFDLAAGDSDEEEQEYFPAVPANSEDEPLGQCRAHMDPPLVLAAWDDEDVGGLEVQEAEKGIQESTALHEQEAEEVVANTLQEAEKGIQESTALRKQETPDFEAAGGDLKSNLQEAEKGIKVSTALNEQEAEVAAATGGDLKSNLQEADKGAQESTALRVQEAEEVAATSGDLQSNLQGAEKGTKESTALLEQEAEDFAAISGNLKRNLQEAEQGTQESTALREQEAAEVAATGGDLESNPQEAEKGIKESTALREQEAEEVAANGGDLQSNLQDADKGIKESTALHVQEAEEGAATGGDLKSYLQGAEKGIKESIAPREQDAEDVAATGGDPAPRSSGKVDCEETKRIELPQVDCDEHDGMATQDEDVDKGGKISDDLKWQYLDTKGGVQGPFSSEQMLVWHKGGYFSEELLLRYAPGDLFVALGELYPSPLRPFLDPSMPVAVSKSVLVLWGGIRTQKEERCEMVAFMYGMQMLRRGASVQAASDACRSESTRIADMARGLGIGSLLQLAVVLRKAAVALAEEV